MALTAKELNELKTALTDGIAQGFKNVNFGGGGGTTGGGTTGGGTTGGNTNNSARDRQIEELEKEIKGLKNNENFSKTAFGQQFIQEKEVRLQRLKNNGIAQKDIEDYNKRVEKEKAIAKNQKVQKAKAKATAVIDVVKGIAEIVIAAEKRKIAIANAQVDYNAKMMELSLQRQTLIISSGVKNLTGGFNKTATEMAYENTQSAYEISKTATITGQQEKIAGKTFRKEVDKANAAFSVATIGAAAGIGAAIGSIIPGLGTAVGAAVGAIIGAVGGLIGNIFSNAAEIDIARKELNIKEAELASKITESQLNQLKEFAEPFDKLYKDASDLILKLNDVGREFGATIGYTGDDFARSVINMTQKTVSGGKTLVELFGKEAEKLPEYMNNYMSTAGRQVNFSAEDYGNIMGTSKLFGISGAESAQLYGSMNIFNTSISSAADSLGVMYHQVTKMGLSTRQFSKDLVKNLKLAEKYNFKGGVENMMKITKWAMQTRFNLDSAASFSESIQNGNLSDVLEKSAKLQVLGGASAMYSDPFKLMYDAWNDTGDMAQRMAAMFNDITARFDKETGKTDFGIFGSRMIVERAKALGMDPGDVRRTLIQQTHQAEINRVLGDNDRLSEPDKLAIGNRATWDVKKQRWVVADKFGETHDIMDYANGTAKIEDLLPVETNEAILEVVSDILSVQKKLEHEQESNIIKMGAQEQGNIYETTVRELKELHNLYKENWGEMTDAFGLARENSESLFHARIEQMKNLANHLDILRNIYRGVQADFLKSVNKMNIGEVREISIIYARGGGEALGQINLDKLLTTPEMVDDGYGNINGGIITNVSGATSINDGMVTGYNTIKRGDTIGNTGGGYISNVTSVKPINDGTVNVKTAKNDQYLAAMPNGPIDKILQQLIPGLQALLKGNNSTSHGNIDINFGGKLMLEQGNSNINLVDIIRNNPMVANKMVSLLERAVETKNNGKSVINYKL